LEGPLLEVRDLAVSFFTDRGELPAVRGISLDVAAGETLALVGESGCGKSVTALAVMGLIEHPGRVVGGSLRFRGRDLLALSDEEMRGLRGGEIGMIFQEPMTSLNPVFKVGDQIGEVLQLHRGLGEDAARKEAARMLDRVRIPSPEQRVEQYPHELSGGMKQRVMIAMALACDPALLIADEPTTALDVTIQAQILELLHSLQQELGMAILLITHNLGVVAHFSERVAVMYAGRIVEEAPVRPLFREAAHPYTRALLAALPRPGVASRLAAIPGSVPSPLLYPPGCAFHDRCAEALPHCREADPERTQLGAGHGVCCWLHGGQP